ncbi:hypothetical protein [Agromyces marinus]|nr:hypothetical protein [Agromyces marinus]
MRDLGAAVPPAGMPGGHSAEPAPEVEAGAAASALRTLPVGRRTTVARPAPQPSGPDGPFAQRPPRRTARSQGARRLAGVVSMAFVAMLALATSVPSLSLLTPEEVQAMALAQAATSTLKDGQRVDISGNALAAGVGREDYQAQTIEEYAQAAGIRAEATFTNNPSARSSGRSRSASTSATDSATAIARGARRTTAGRTSTRGSARRSRRSPTASWSSRRMPAGRSASSR